MFKYHVNSCSISAIGYDEQSRTLEIDYIKKGTYQYLNVPFIISQRLMVAKNKQSYINRCIDGAYMKTKTTKQ